MSRRTLHIHERNAGFDSWQQDASIQCSPSNDSQTTLKSLQLADVFDFGDPETMKNSAMGLSSHAQPDRQHARGPISPVSVGLILSESQRNRHYTHPEPPLFYGDDKEDNDFEYQDRGAFRRSGHVWAEPSEFRESSFRPGVSVVSEGDEFKCGPGSSDALDEVVFLQDGDETLEYGSPHDDDVLFVEREDDDPFDEVIFLESDDTAARLVRAAADDGNETSFFWELIRFQKTRCWKKKAMTILVSLTSLYIFIDLLFLGNVQKGINVLLQWMDNNPVGASFSFVGTFIVTALLFIPTAPLIFAAGYCFSNVIGFWSGFAVALVVSLVGLGIGAMLSFFRARFMAQDLVQLFARRYPIVQAADRALHRKGFKIMFLLRLCPLVPFNGLNYIGGVTSVSSRDFALSLFGLLPTNVLWVLVGAGTDKLANRTVQNSGLQIYMGILFGVSLWLAVFGLFVVWKTAMKELRKEIALNSAENWYRYNKTHDNTDDAVNLVDIEKGSVAASGRGTEPPSSDSRTTIGGKCGDPAPVPPLAVVVGGGPMDLEISFAADEIGPGGGGDDDVPRLPRGSVRRDCGGGEEKSYDCDDCDEEESVIFMAPEGMRPSIRQESRTELGFVPLGSPERPYCGVSA